MNESRMFSCGEAAAEFDRPYDEMFPLASDLELLPRWRKHFTGAEKLPTGQYLVTWRGDEYVMGVQAEFETGLINYYWESEAEEYHHHEWARLRPLEDGCEVRLAAAADHDASGVSRRLEEELEMLSELAAEPSVTQTV